MTRPALRLAYVISYYRPAYAFGGPVRSVSALCESLAALGVAVSVFTTDADLGGRLDVPLGRPVCLDGVEVTYHASTRVPPRSYYFSPALARACTRRLGGFDVAVIDALYSHAILPAAAACRRAGVPYVVPLRGQLLPWAMRHGWLKKTLYLKLAGLRLLNGAAATLCTDISEVEAAQALGVRAPACLIPNSVDAARYASLPPRGALRQRLGIPAEAPAMLFLGRLHRLKRPDLAVQALAAASGLPLPAHLVLAGPDEGRVLGGLRAEARRLGCAGRLHWAGLLEGDAPLQALADADLLLMPSESESFGNAALEALAAGVPVLVSDRVPVGRWAEAAGAGRRVPCAAADFRQAAADMLADPAGLRSMGAQGRALAREKFDRPALMRQALHQFQAIARTGRPLPQAGPGPAGGAERLRQCAS